MDAPVRSKLQRSRQQELRRIGPKATCHFGPVPLKSLLVIRDPASKRGPSLQLVESNMMKAQSPPRLFLSLGLIATVMALIGTAALAADTAAIDQQVAATLDRFYQLSDQNKYLAQNAAAVLVFPKITKAGIGIGGEHGDGALQENGKSVGYYSISGASIGLTLGVSQHSEVILFNTPQARDKFLKGGDWSIGGDASVAVMKNGAGETYDTETMKKPVLAFIFGEKGLMGDASLQGAKISKIAQ
jgi:lipid-binding SYLF domain-containing protein